MHVCAYVLRKQANRLQVLTSGKLPRATYLGGLLTSGFVYLAPNSKFKIGKPILPRKICYKIELGFFRALLTAIITDVSDPMKNLFPTDDGKPCFKNDLNDLLRICRKTVSKLTTFQDRMELLEAIQAVERYTIESEIK